MSSHATDEATGKSQDDFVTQEQYETDIAIIIAYGESRSQGQVSLPAKDPSIPTPLLPCKALPTLTMCQL